MSNHSNNVWRQQKEITQKKQWELKLQDCVFLIDKEKNRSTFKISSNLIRLFGSFVQIIFVPKLKLSILKKNNKAVMYFSWKVGTNCILNHKYLNSWNEDFACIMNTLTCICGLPAMLYNLINLIDSIVLEQTVQSFCSEKNTYHQFCFQRIEIIEAYSDIRIWSVRNKRKVWKDRSKRIGTTWCARITQDIGYLFWKKSQGLIIFSLTMIYLNKIKNYRHIPVLNEYYFI